jgi:SAM-dependent methyltransferase
VPDAPDTTDAAAVERFARCLEAAGFTQASIAERVGPGALAALRRQWNAPAVTRLSGGTPFDVLGRLFVAGVDVGREEAVTAFSSEDVDAWTSIGVVAERGGFVQPLVELQPVGMDGDEIIVAHDRLHDGPPRADAVMGFAGSSGLLAGAMVRRPCRRALDVGTGTGAQAMLASRWCEEVVAVDASPRALAFARLNLGINRITNVELRAGDRFDAVEGEEFDLVVANPPFVVSPDHELLYRDGGLPGDAMTATIVRGAAGHLAPDGWAVVVGNWIYPPDGEWDERVAAWVRGTGCDAWAIERHVRDAFSYAAGWVGEAPSTHRDQRDGQFRNWLEYYRREGIASIGYGLVVCRRTAGGARWFRADELRQELVHPFDDAVVRVFWLMDWLHGRDDAGVLGASFAVAPDARLETIAVAEGRWMPASYRLYADGRLAVSMDISDGTAEIVGACDGSRSLREVLVDWAAVEGADQETIVAAVAVCRELVANGFLIPTDLIG